MIQSNRRQFVTIGLVGALYALNGSGAWGAALAAPIFPRPFAGSRTVSSFASGLFLNEDGMPLALRDAIEAELARADMAPDGPLEERQCAEFFAWLAVRTIAPCALRRAGYHALAADCESQSDLWNGSLATAGAQHAIGKQYAYSSTPRLASFAYGASAHATTAAFYAGHEDVEVVTETGHYCARALLEAFSCEGADGAHFARVWDFAVATINTSIDLALRESARQDRKLDTTI